MPQLKIIDVKNDLDVLITRVDEIAGVVNELKSCIEGVVVAKSNAPEDAEQAIVRISEELKQLRKDTAAHVDVYNKHIMQQHRVK